MHAVVTAYTDRKSRFLSNGNELTNDSDIPGIFFSIIFLIGLGRLPGTARKLTGGSGPPLTPPGHASVRLSVCPTTPPTLLRLG